MNLIDQQADPFLALLDSYGDVNGMLWEELVIRFEWTFEIQKYWMHSELEEEIKIAVQDASLAKKVKFCFNGTMVDDWSLTLLDEDRQKGKQGIIESFVTYVLNPKN